MGERTYVAATMAEALRQVKQDLGRDAVVLQTRYVRKGRVLGWLTGRRMWEITAAARPDAPPPPQPAEGLYLPEDEPARPPQQPRPTHNSPSAAPPAEAAEPFNDVRKMLQTLVERSTAPVVAAEGNELVAVQARLLDEDVDPQIVTELVAGLRMDLTGRELNDADLVWSKARRLLAERIQTVTAEPELPQDRPYVVALVGPTGVGKTTTIAKLAATYKLRSHKQVGLITMDTYRIAAVEQLRTYAEIIDLPIRTVLTPAELHQAVGQMREVDVILLDTAGRSQNNRLRLTELRRFLEAGCPDETHLVLSATASRRTARAILEKFSAVGPNRLILSKLDEAGGLGLAVNAAVWSSLPLSWLTTGQEVPDDLARADADGLARGVLRDEPPGGVDTP